MNMDKPGQQMRITEEELTTLKKLFKGNHDLLKLLRKLFLPELDPYVPIGQNIDLWMTIPVDNMKAEEALINLKARNTVITHLEQVLNTIRILVEVTDETPEELREKLKKDSSK